jgi:IS30 family transposase
MPRFVFPQIIPEFLVFRQSLDTVVGPRGHSKAVLLTLIDRKSRFLWEYRLKDRTTATVFD